MITKEDSGFKKGDYVWITDYPFGRPLNLSGKIVGILRNDYYNILLENGMNEGSIVKFKYWSLLRKNEQCRKERQERQGVSMVDDDPTSP